MRKLPLLFLAASVASCGTLRSSSNIRNYADLESGVGQEVTLVGYWSAQHEATGIYFGQSEYRDAPRRCVMTDRPLEVDHGSAVRVSGTLERSGCGEELICLTVCQPFLLKNTQSIR